ncbi:MAG: nucleotide kinase domain-containing protein [Sterolibacterium sp.]|jgi:thymidylate kinase
MTIKSPGHLFVFEGPDGVGKSALARLLFDNLRSASIECELLAFPGRETGTLGRLVYDLHHDPRTTGVNSLSATALQAVHVAAHIDAIESKIVPALESGRTVILDRYWWSTRVYGLANGASDTVINKLIQAELATWRGITPSTVFLIHRTEPLRNEPIREWRRWCSAYTKLANIEAKSYPVCMVANEGRIEDALQEVLRSVSGQRARTTEATVSSVSMPMPSFRQAPLVFTALSPAKPTVVYDTYWKFAAERQEIFFKRLSGLQPHWTDDPILQAHKFTNAYRASDRVSQFLIQKVIYEGDQSPAEVFFRTLLFKLFNKIETWNLLESKLGTITFSEYTFDRYDQILTQAMAKGTKIYSAAYIMPSGSKIFQTDRKHRAHLQLLSRMMDDELYHRIADARSMQESFRLLLSYPMIGDFLAYQFATDLNYSTLTDFSEMDFVVPGPGALNGIRKCFSSLGGLNEVDIIRVVADRQEDEFRRLGISFQTLWGRRLQLIDCQNLFCEVDKYSRVKHPEIVGVTQRTRIKQKFRITPTQIRFWYPPKWGINGLIPEAT